MKNRFSKAALLLGLAITLSTAGFAQEESKVKIERDDYELKVKREGDEYKWKEKGVRPADKQSMTIHRGQSVMTVKAGALPKAEPAPKARKPVAKKSYASKKKCTCKPVAKKATTRKRSVAYKPKARKTTRTAVVAAKPAPVIVRDTVFITRVDTVFSMMEPAFFTGHRIAEGQLPPGLKKLKVEKENDGIEVTEEYLNGDKIKREFDTDEDLNTYMKWKYD